MNDAPDEAFRSVASGFRKSLGYKMETLSPHEAAVLELRVKGASYPLIARMLGNIGVHVSAQTLRRFCLRSETSRNPARPAPAAIPSPTTPSENPKAKSLPTQLASSNTPPTRGPRIADPSTQ